MASSPTTLTNSGLAQFLEMCFEAESFYLANPKTKYETWIFLCADGRLDSDTVEATYPPQHLLADARTVILELGFPLMEE
jgi:uncharacterized protein YegL